MARTDNFRKQHEEIMSLARAVNGMLAPVLAAETALEIRKALSKLQGLVTIHLAMEDKSFYPMLMNSENADTRETARAYSREMGEIAGAFTQYLGRWATAPRIQADPTTFGVETKALFNALSKRIHKENTHLYELADKMG